MKSWQERIELTPEIADACSRSILFQLFVNLETFALRKLTLAAELAKPNIRETFKADGYVRLTKDFMAPTSYVEHAVKPVTTRTLFKILMGVL